MASTTEVGKLAIELAFEATNADKQIKAIDKSIGNLEKGFKAGAKGVKDYEKTYTGLDAKIQKTSKQLELYSTKLSKQKEEYSKLESTVTKQKAKLDELENTLGKGSKEWQQQAQLVQKNSEKLNKLGTDIKGTEGNINKLTKELDKSQQEFNELGNNTKTLGEKLDDIDRKTALAESEFNKLASTSKYSGESLKTLKNDMDQVANKLDAGKQKVDAYESEIKKLSSQLQANKTSHKDLGSEINKTESELSKAKREYGENSKEANQLKTKLLNLKDEFNNLEREIDEGEKELTQYQTALNNTQAEVNELSRELNQMPFDRVGQSLQNTGQKVKGVGQTLTASVTAPTIAAGTAAGKMAYDYDQGLSKVGSLVQKSGKEMREYDDTIKQMSRNTGVSLAELTESMYQGISAGGDLNNIFKLTEVAAKSAIGGFTSTDVAIDGLTSTMNTFGISYEDVDKVANKFLLTQNKGKTSFGELASSIGKVAPVAAQAGVGINELLSATAALTMNGIATSEAMTATKAALSNIIKPGAEAQKIAKKLGIEFNVAGLKSKGLSKFLEDIKVKTGGNIETMGKLFGSTEALNAMLVLTSEKGAKTFNDILGEMGGELNLVDEAFNNMTESSGAQLLKAFNSMKVSFSELGDAIAPVIDWLAEKITALADWFGGLDDSTKTTIVTFGLLAAAIGPILIGVGQLIFFGGQAVTMLGSLTAGATATASATATTTGAFSGLTGAAGMLASPVGLGALAIALIGIMAYIGDSETSILGLQEKFGGLGYIIGAVCEFISGIVQLTFGNLIILVQGACDTIAAMMDGPGGQTIEDAQNRMHAKLTLNTEEAWMKITNTTSRGLSQMRAMNEIELGVLSSTFDTILNQLPLITDGKYNEAANKISHHLQVMDSNQLLALTGMNDTTKMLFQGIKDSMTVEEKTNQVAWNMKQMADAGKLNADTMQKDVNSAMDTLQKQIDSKTKQASQNADINTKNLANKVDSNTKQADNKANTNTQQLANDINKNTQNAAIQADKNTKNLGNKIDANTKTAGNKTDTNTKDLTNKIDANTKDASSKADVNTKEIAKKVDNNTKEMAKATKTNAEAMKNSAINAANQMKQSVLSATQSMANGAINNWNSIRNAYSRSITGKVSINRTINTVNRSSMIHDENSPVNYEIPKIDISQYKIKSNEILPSKFSNLKYTQFSLGKKLKNLESKLLNSNGDIKIELHLDKVEIKNDDDYKSLAKKLVNDLEIELEKRKSKKKKIKGGKVSA